MDDHLGSDPDGALLCDKISMQYLFSKSFTYFIESYATLPVLSHFPSIAYVKCAPIERA
jgi:hypothetical protein